MIGIFTTNKYKLLTYSEHQRIEDGLNDYSIDFVAVSEKSHLNFYNSVGNPKWIHKSQWSKTYSQHLTMSFEFSCPDISMFLIKTLQK